MYIVNKKLAENWGNSGFDNMETIGSHGYQKNKALQAIGKSNCWGANGYGYNFGHNEAELKRTKWNLPPIKR
jgi:hypothetical protein